MCCVCDLPLSIISLHHLPLYSLSLMQDEADLLGDRIAIMGHGRLRCVGSSLFLKKMYGVGYNMTVEKASANSFNSKGVMSLISNRVPDAKILSDVGTEFSVQLPFSSSSHFQSLFENLDDNLSSLGIQSYGMSVTTLEEVFLKVADSMVRHYSCCLCLCL